MRSLVASVLCAASIVALLGARPWAERFAQNAAESVESLIERGLYDRAEERAQGDVERLTRANDSDVLDVAAASDGLARALTLNGKGSLPATIALAERALNLKQSRLGGSHPDLAISLINLGTALGEAAVHPRSISLLERAVALRQEPGGGGTVLAEALDALGSELVRAGQYDRAVSTLQRSLTIKESTRGTDVSTATTLNALTLALQQKGDYPGARVAVDRASALQRRGSAHPVFVTTVTWLGQQFWFEGAWLEARNVSARAVDLAQQVLRPDHPAVALALRYLAANLLDLGDVGQAKPLQERALAIIERGLGPNHYEASAFLNGLGDSNVLLGDYPGARLLYERALSIAEAKLGTQSSWVAGLEHNLALVDAHLGDYARARQRQARATAIWERALGRDHPRVSVALMELAAVHREQGATAEALTILERALAIRERSLGANHRDVARTLADLAATLVQARRMERAQTLATRALRILEQVDAPEAPDLATVLDLYAQLQASRGDNRAARDYFDRALAIKEKVFGPAHPAFADTQVRLAVALAHLGDPNGAFNVATSAETTGREHLRLMLRYLPERQSLNYAATRPRGLDLILSLVGSVPDATAIGLDGLIRSRALVLDEMAKRRNTVRSPSEGTAPLAASLARARQRLVNVVVRGPGDLTPTRYAALVEDARRESERAEQRLAERSAVFSAELRQAQVGLEEVRAALPAGSALVSFVRHEQTSVNGATITAYLAFVLKTGQSPAAVRLGPVETIDALVRTWRADIAAEALGGGRTRAAASSRSSGVALRKLIWDPLVRHMSGAGRILVVPDGTLSVVPFEALPVQESAYLVEQGPVIHYVSAERDVVLSAAAPLESSRSLLALGGPAFDDRTIFGARAGRASSATPSSATPASPLTPLSRDSTPAFRSAVSECGSLQHITFPRLDGSLQEVHEVAKLWNAPETSAVRVLVGHEASERTFKEEASRYRVLHLATHGFFLGESCERDPEGSRGTRAVGGVTTASAPRANQARRENPLLLSGLALAGANRRSSARPDEDDGILTAEEVASLNLGGVEWAVLSACDTGLGEIKAGEGVFGLRRAFQVAGARTVIMSLWSVDDQAARAWMRALYEGRFQKSLTTADAVHAASLAVLRERRAKGQSTLPFYWAAFVAAGDWR